VPSHAVRPGTPASGILLKDGYVLTSAYHIDKASTVSVRFPAGALQAAETLGTDREADLALLRVDRVPDGAVPIELSETFTPTIGQLLVAVGRGPEASLTVNTGIVSALGRLNGLALQTDAAVNHANIGGAAISLNGTLVGMLARVSPRAGINSGVGFVTPTKRILRSLTALQEGKVVPKPPRPFMGIQFGKEHMDPPGGELERVLNDTGAARAGLLKGDVIERFDGAPVRDSLGLAGRIREKRPGDKVSVQVRREGQVLDLEITLGVRPGQ